MFYQLFNNYIINIEKNTIKECYKLLNINFGFILQWMFLSLYMVIVFIMGLIIFFHFIYLPYKHRSVHLSAKELFETLQVILTNEIRLYENSIFDKKDMVLSNSTFENYYNDICGHVVDSISPDFMYRIKFYITEEEVVSIICKNVKAYLLDKLEEQNITLTNSKTEEDETTIDIPV